MIGDKSMEGEPVAYMGGAGVCLAEDVSNTPNWTDYYYTPLFKHPATLQDLKAAAEKLGMCVVPKELIDAVDNLIAVKGRYHAEQAMKRLLAASQMSQTKEE